jgi:hypothetical protein
VEKLAKEGQAHDRGDRHAYPEQSTVVTVLHQASPFHFGVHFIINEKKPGGGEAPQALFTVGW